MNKTGRRAKRAGPSGACAPESKDRLSFFAAFLSDNAAVEAAHRQYRHDDSEENPGGFEHLFKNGIVKQGGKYSIGKPGQDGGGDGSADPRKKETPALCAPV